MKHNIYNFIGTKVRPIELAAFLKWALRIKREIINIHGSLFYVDPISNFGIRLNRTRTYEPHITQKINELLKPGDSFIDLGGNEGYFSIIASKLVGEKGTVYCIEPQNRLHNIILKNININRYYNVFLFPYAISDARKEDTLILSPDINTGSTTLLSEKRRFLWKRQKTFSTTLDELFVNKKNKSIKLIKIDIEGFEYHALKGATNLLKKE